MKYIINIITLAAIAKADKRSGPNAVYPLSSNFTKVLIILSADSVIGFYIIFSVLSVTSIIISSNFINLSPAITN